MNDFIVYINLTVIFVFSLIVSTTLFHKKEKIALRLSFSFPFIIVILTCLVNLFLFHLKMYNLFFLGGIACLFTTLYGASLLYYVYSLLEQKIPRFLNIQYAISFLVFIIALYDCILPYDQQVQRVNEIVRGENTFYNTLNAFNLLNAIFFCVWVKIKIKNIKKLHSENTDFWFNHKIKWASNYMNYMIGSMILFVLIAVSNAVYNFFPFFYGDLVVMPLFMLAIYSFITVQNNTYQKESEWQYKMMQIESQNVIQNQRLSISRDLHDTIGSQLTFIISSVDNLKYSIADTTNPKIEGKLSTISSFAKNTVAELRDTIWVMNKEEMKWEDLEIRIISHLDRAQLAVEAISFSFAIEESLKGQTFQAIHGMNIYRTIQEAINNAIKHAQATVIMVNIKKVEQQIKIMIQDNGVGFDTQDIVSGNGIPNMKKRIEEIGGYFNLVTSPEGTRIEILLSNT